MTSVIESIDCYVLDVPLRREIADALYTRTHWRIPVVEIRTKDGLVGTGYSGIWDGHDLIVDAIDRYLAPLLIGQDASCIGELWNRMYWSDLHWVGRAGVAHMALGMVDTALWDMAAKRAEMPLWKMLGGTSRELETYNTDGGWLNFTVDELVEDMMGMVDSGWQSVKMKIGGSDPRVDMERIRIVRSVLPASTNLMVDVNQKWDLFTARRYVGVLEELNVNWLEEPLHPDDVTGHAELSKLSAIPIALGENIYSTEGFVNFINADAVDVVQVDVTRVGGVSEWMRIAHSALAASRRVIPHAGDMMQVHQHLAASLIQLGQPMIEYLPWALEVFEEPVQMRGSRIILPTTPGASSTVSAEARRRFEGVRSVR